MIASRRRKPRRRPVVVSDPSYRDWIRTLPCRICYLEIYAIMGMDDIIVFALGDLSRFRRQKSRTECAHVGDRGSGQRCPDRETLPLCVGHHREGKEAHHGPLGRNWWTHHGLERAAVIRQLNEAYERGAE